MALRTSMAQATAVSTYYDVVSGVSGGSQLISITMHAQSTTSAGKVRTWLYDGTDRVLVDEVEVPEVTSSSTVKGWSSFVSDPFLVLASSSWKIQIELTVANTIDVIARVDDL